jgi:hypothetical protein
MTTRTVGTERPPAYLHFPSPDTSLVRAEEMSLPAQRHVAEASPLHTTAANESALNTAMQLQICDQIRMLGKLQQAAEDSHAILLAENTSLRQQIPQRLEALESEWLCRAENLSTKVDLIYHKLTQFHRQFCAEAQEAHSLCLTKNPLCMTAEKRKIDCGVSEADSFLQPLFKVHDISQRALALCVTPFGKNAPQKLAVLSPTDYYFGVNLGHIEVEKKINDHFNEIITHVEALEEEAIPSGNSIIL